MITEGNPSEHPAFPQPVDQSAAIWRYMTFDKFETLVTTRTLYMRRADKFPGDEFEGTTPAGDIAAWERSAVAAKTEEERKAILFNRSQLAGYAEAFRQAYYISCWHMASDENVAMWERYTPGTTEAVVIRTRYSSLKGQINRLVVQFGMVRYIDYDADALPSLNMLERISHKRHFFHDEREVRAVMCAIAPEAVSNEYIRPYVTSDTFGYIPPIDPLTLVEAVVLHPGATPDWATRVADFCALHGLPVPLQSRMSSKPRF